MSSGSADQPGPDFIGIGAQKCGTTWLAANLASHPEIWMPPRKELHYFDRSTIYPSPSILASERPLTRLFGFEEHNKIFRRKMAWAVLDNIRSFDRDRAGWNVRYFLGHYDDEWYTSLFKKGSQKICGEITPSYSMLSEEDVAKVALLVPHARILFLIRNPIDRAWSQLRFETRKKGIPVESLTYEAVCERVNSPAYALRGDYVRTLLTWQRFYPSNQFFIGFFDDIVARPLDLLASIYEFLGVSNVNLHEDNAAFRVVNPSPKKDIPDAIREYLVGLYSDQVKELSDLVGGHASAWKEESVTCL